MRMKRARRFPYALPCLAMAMTACTSGEEHAVITAPQPFEPLSGLLNDERTDQEQTLRTILEHERPKHTEASQLPQQRLFHSGDDGGLRDGKIHPHPDSCEGAGKGTGKKMPEDAGWDQTKTVHSDGGGGEKSGRGAHVCDFDVVGNLSLVDFRAKYMGQRPVVVDGVADDWPATSEWTRSALKERYGHVHINTGTSYEHGTESGGYPTGRLASLGELLDQMANGDRQADAGAEALYGFDGDLFFNNTPELMNDYSDPGYMAELAASGHSRYRNFFVLGAAGTGLVMHRHWEAWNTVIHGKKHWYLYPPSAVPPLQFPVVVSIQEWLAQIYPEIKRLALDGNVDVSLPLECTQHAGQLIYIPEGWYHSTVNLVETIGVARQIQFDVKNGPILSDSPMYWRTVARNGNNGTAPWDAMHAALKLIPNDSQALADLSSLYIGAGESFFGLQCCQRFGLRAL